jgi:alpha-tubulin suppressor-like RCC1 family protein
MGDYYSAVFNSHDTFTFGGNNVGQLGLNHNDYTNTPAYVGLLCGKHVTQIACGGAHILALTVDDNLSAFGWNDSGQLGLGHNDNKNQPVRVPFFCGKHVTQIACGNQHSIVLTSDDELFAFGNNGYGQLGLSHYDDNHAPQRLEFFRGQRVKQIACGDSHCMVLVADDLVFSFGRNNCSQLGIGHTHKKATPQRVETLCGAHVSQIACGGFHNLALTADDELFAFGRNHCGQLGLTHNVDENEPQVRDSSHSLAYSLNSHPRNLAHSPTRPLTDLPTHPPMQRVATMCGKNSTHISCGGFHSLVLTADDQLYAFGRNNCGQLGLGQNDKQNTPQRVVQLCGRHVLQVACGGFHSLVLTADDTLYGFGLNNCGQLGLRHYEQENTPRKVTSLSRSLSRSLSLALSLALALALSVSLSLGLSLSRSLSRSLSLPCQSTARFRHCASVVMCVT